MRRFLVCTAILVSITAAAPAHAELVFFESGRAMSVKAIRSDGDQLVLQLRSGGEIHCDKNLITKVAPDEFPYPEDIQKALPVFSAMQEPPSVPAQYKDLIARTASKHGVDARIVSAVIQVESAFHSQAVSPKGALGLMQVMPATGRKFGALDLFDPKVNIDAGVQYLKKLLARYPQLPVALAAYNAGEAAVDRFGGVPPFRETQDYVSRILRILSRRS